MLGANEEMADIDPNILRIILTKGDRECAIQVDILHLGTPIDWFIRISGPTSKQVKAILYASPNAVAWVIWKIYTGMETAQSKLLTMALDAGYGHELRFFKNDDNGFLNESLIDSGDLGGYGEMVGTLVDVIFKNVAKGKVTLFRRILKLKARAIL
jgi:hypothetical protein